MIPPKTPMSSAYFRILNRLWKKGPASAVVLCRELGISRTLCEKMIDSMMEEGVAGASSEKSSEYVLRDDYGSVLGIHMGTRTVTSALVSFTGQLLMTKELPLPERGTPLPTAILQVVTKMEEFIRPPAAPVMRGVAISLPGIVDPYKLTLIKSNPLEIFEPIAFKETVGRALSRPLTVENDANCCCWGEAVLNRQGTMGNFLSILAEQRPHQRTNSTEYKHNIALGMGLYLNGTVYHGSEFSAGEFQSILKANPSNKNQFSLTDEQLHLSETDTEIEELIMREIARHAGLLVNLLNLNRVFVSWPKVDRASRIVQIIQEEIQHNWSYEGPVDCPVQQPAMGLFAPAYGAAALHLESIYQTADGSAPYFPGKS